MADQTDPKPAAAGCLLSLAILIGATIGMFLRQPSAGVVGGAAVGIAIAILYWLYDKRRTGQ